MIPPPWPAVSWGGEKRCPRPESSRGRYMIFMCCTLLGWSSANFTPDNAKGPLHVQGAEWRWMMYQGHLQQLSRKRTRKSGKSEHQIGWADIWKHLNLVWPLWCLFMSSLLFWIHISNWQGRKGEGRKVIGNSQNRGCFAKSHDVSSWRIWRRCLLGRTWSIHDRQSAGWREGQTACRSHQRHSGTDTDSIRIIPNPSNC